MSYDFREKLTMTFLLFALGCGFGFLYGLVLSGIFVAVTGEVTSWPVLLLSGLAGGVSTTAFFWRRVVMDD